DRWRDRLERICITDVERHLARWRGVLALRQEHKVRPGLTDVPAEECIRGDAHDFNRSVSLPQLHRATDRKLARPERVCEILIDDRRGVSRVPIVRVPLAAGARDNPEDSQI